MPTISCWNGCPEKALWPHSNGKLEKDLDKLKGRPEKHRYVFFMSPRFPCAPVLPVPPRSKKPRFKNTSATPAPK